MDDNNLTSHYFSISKPEILAKITIRDSFIMFYGYFNWKKTFVFLRVFGISWLHLELD